MFIGTIIKTNMQNKKLILPISIYITVEIIYYIGYSTLGMKTMSNPANEGVALLFWITFSLVNTYFVVYALLPDYLKRSMKRKNIVLKILFYFAIVLIGFLITNGPVDKI